MVAMNSGGSAMRTAAGVSMNVVLSVAGGMRSVSAVPSTVSAEPMSKAALMAIRRARSATLLRC
jgi:radical SAM superfamily enzyme with C-terminal helix-hairpin-helix motif